jgi:hypothetical protein
LDLLNVDHQIPELVLYLEALGLHFDVTFKAKELANFSNLSRIYHQAQIQQVVIAAIVLERIH